MRRIMRHLAPGPARADPAGVRAGTVELVRWPLERVQAAGDNEPMTRRGTLKRLLCVAAATGAMAVAAPLASAASLPFTFPAWSTTGGFAAWPTSGGFPAWPTTGGIGAIGVGGNQIGSAGCVGTNRPSVGGNNGSTSAQTCGALLSFVGPQIGQIASVVGPTVIGSPAAVVMVSAGPITVMP
jgi:hypothetical protein